MAKIPDIKLDMATLNAAADAAMAERARLKTLMGPKTEHAPMQIVGKTSFFDRFRKKVSPFELKPSQADVWLDRLSLTHSQVFTALPPAPEPDTQSDSDRKSA